MSCGRYYGGGGCGSRGGYYYGGGGCGGGYYSAGRSCASARSCYSANWENSATSRCFNYGACGAGGCSSSSSCTARSAGGGGGASAFISASTACSTYAAAPSASAGEVLTVENVDFNIAENTERHQTSEYECTEGPNGKLVVRRGQEFRIKIDFNRKYDPSKDDLRLVFRIGDKPKASKGTHVEFILSDKDEKNQWGAKLEGSPTKTIGIVVFTPPNCLVGKWDFKVDVVTKKDQKTNVFRYNHPDPIYMLFNPWCKDDTVYMESAKDRETYVLCDKGKIYSGSCKNISGKPWVFGQFAGEVLECSMYLLDVCGMNYTARGNPITIARKLSAVVNSQDDGGVLTGNWSGDYSGGKSPLSWTGSQAILEQYLETKFSVQFGQCWVFSGVLTSVFRALGLPARSVTNFSSAHDCDASITIDYHFDAEGNPLDYADEDSVWNFHVWNEVWMARPDLPKGYGGWQACDATPQETSDGMYCCGPCPVRAIKEGEVNLPFDCPFVFAEVNADKVYWVKEEDGSSKVAHVEKNSVGKFISSCTADGERDDVTCHYKHPENSPEERVAVRKANQVGSCRQDIYQEGPKDVEFELVDDDCNCFVGSECVITLCCKNTSNQTRTLYGQISASSMYYTGVSADKLGSEKLSGISVKPGETKKVCLKLSPDQYLDKLKDMCMISTHCLVRVVETKQIFSKKDLMRLRKPHLTVTCANKGKGKVGEEFELVVSFTNPLNTALTNCCLDVEGIGITKNIKCYQRGVPVNGTFMANVPLTPKKPGKKHMVLVFHCKQLEDINGTYDMVVSA